MGAVTSSVRWQSASRLLNNHAERAPSGARFCLSARAHSRPRAAATEARSFSLASASGGGSKKPPFRSGVELSGFDAAEPTKLGAALHPAITRTGAPACSDFNFF